ncbi:MAG: molybdenum cofactor guanylyltransferase [Rhodospirillaceae bacterium]|nr:molybdenum cofactor guanylyltransferase [Rhodospirillaceae bacterium]
MFTAQYRTSAVAVIAGGEGRRLGGLAKATLEIGGAHLIHRVLGRLKSQASHVAVCVRAEAGWLDTVKEPVLFDLPAFEGPLAGVASALVWVATLPQIDTLVTVGVDYPFLPDDLVARLSGKPGIAVACSGGQSHHLIAGWPLSAREKFLQGIAAGERAVHRLQARFPSTAVEWPCQPVDPFFNINTPEDLERARTIS